MCGTALFFIDIFAYTHEDNRHTSDAEKFLVAFSMTALLQGALLSVSSRHTLAIFFRHFGALSQQTPP
jgi:hypothetical protein